MTDKEEAELLVQAVAQLAKRQPAAVSLRWRNYASTQFMKDPLKYLAKNDAFFDKHNASKNRNSRYRPSVKALENTFGNNNY